jgi:hypothetical protein
MELADLGVAAGQQLGIQLAGDGLQLLGRDAVGGRVHAVAPAPEVVRCAGVTAASLRATHFSLMRSLKIRLCYGARHEPAVGRVRVLANDSFLAVKHFAREK